MPSSTFRIESVSVEGFKAFTKQQIFHFGGRHVFLFGPNGLGKTSIVEAIRWCLFGLASRQGDIIKNQFYAGSCIVQITLAGPNGSWIMQRRLRSGGEGRLTIRDPSGTERNLEDVFPQLSRIGPREGTHVIYAAQQPSSRRPEADITDFSYVVYRYLGLEEVPRLSDVLLTLGMDWKEQEDRLCRSVEELGESLSQRISGVEESLSRITADPPWGTAQTPTNADTRSTIDSLAKEAEELGAPCSTQDLEGLSADAKLYEVDTALHSFLSGELENLKHKLIDRQSEMQDGESRLEGARSASDKLRHQSDIRERYQQDLDATLNGVLLEDLEKQFEKTEADFESTQLKLDVVRSSLKYLEASGSTALCPTCESGVLLNELKLHLQEAEAFGDSETRDKLTRRDLLKERVSEARRLSQRIDEADKGIAQHTADLSDILEQTKQAFDLPSLAFIESLAAHVEEIRKNHQNLQAALNSRHEALTAWESRIEGASQELRFHQLRTSNRDCKASMTYVMRPSIAT